MCKARSRWHRFKFIRGKTGEGSVLADPRSYHGLAKAESTKGGMMLAKMVFGMHAGDCADGAP